MNLKQIFQFIFGSRMEFVIEPNPFYNYYKDGIPDFSVKHRGGWIYTSPTRFSEVIGLCDFVSDISFDQTRCGSHRTKEDAERHVKEWVKRYYKRLDYKIIYP